MNIKDAAGGSRMERKKEVTKQKIIKIAMELFKQSGVEATTMEQIASAADIAKGTLYNYFPAKEAIISAHIQQSLQDTNPERVNHLSRMPDTRTRMILILGILMEGVQAQPEIFEKFLVYQIQNMISVHRDAGAKSGLRELAREIIVRGQDDGEIRRDLPQDILVALFEFVFVEVAQEYFLQPKNFKARDTIESCADLFMNGARQESSKDIYRLRR